jgi:hypothetical protein
MKKGGREGGIKGRLFEGYYQNSDTPDIASKYQAFIKNLLNIQRRKCAFSGEKTTKGH